MFTVYHSNQVDVLKSLLVELIRLNPLQNPFDKEQILVQSPGMSQWLKMELAKEFGVAANIEFPLPATFIWDMFTHVLADVPKTQCFQQRSDDVEADAFVAAATCTGGVLALSSLSSGR